MLYSDAQDKVLATYYNGDRLRIVPQDDEFAADLAFLRAELPEGDVLPGSMTADERKMLVTVTRAEDPGSVYLFDRDADTVELLYRSRPRAPDGAPRPDGGRPLPGPRRARDPGLPHAAPAASRPRTCRS